MRRLLGLASVCLMLAAAESPAEEYPAPKPAADTSSYGKLFQRSMRLIATSTPQKRNTVRILYYGQSITGQRWSDMVDAELRRRYPQTDFITENLAIGGFSSQLLVRTMYYDVLPFYPDLLVFHVYGSHIEYENIIREIRRRTTAEIIMQSDHVNVWPEPSVADNFWENQKDWGDKMNYFLLPAITEKYHCAWQPQRWEWVNYLKGNNLQPRDLLVDGVHLNEQGKWLMARLLERFMVYLPDEPADEFSGRVTTYEVGKDVSWQGNRLKLEFEGNRVVALAAAGSNGGVAKASARVLIDGKRPSEFPECYTFTRPSGTAGVGWPAIKKITWQKPPVLEEWTATFRDFNDSQDDFKFSVTGSITGPDGEGTGREKFVSNSGRIVIEPEDWVFAYCKQVSKKSTSDGWQVRWKVEPMFTDQYQPAKVDNPAAEHPTVLASNLPNAKHTLELIADGDGKPSLGAIRVHRPPRE